MVGLLHSLNIWNIPCITEILICTTNLILQLFNPDSPIISFMPKLYLKLSFQLHFRFQQRLLKWQQFTAFTSSISLADWSTIRYGSLKFSFACSPQWTMKFHFSVQILSGEWKLYLECFIQSGWWAKNVRLLIWSDMVISPAILKLLLTPFFQISKQTPLHFLFHVFQTCLFRGSLLCSGKHQGIVALLTMSHWSAM